MTSTPDKPQHDGSDLQELRAEIDALKTLPPTGETSPFESQPEPTDAIGSEDWGDEDRHRPHAD